MGDLVCEAGRRCGLAPGGAAKFAQSTFPPLQEGGGEGEGVRPGDWSGFETVSDRAEAQVLALIGLQRNWERLYDATYDRRKFAWRAVCSSVAEATRGGVSVELWESLRLKETLADTCSALAIPCPIPGDCQEVIAVAGMEDRSRCFEAYFICMQPNWQALWTLRVGKITPAHSRTLCAFRRRVKYEPSVHSILLIRDTLKKHHTR